MSNRYINNPIPGTIVRTILLLLTKRNRDNKVEMINIRRKKEDDLRTNTTTSAPEKIKEQYNKLGLPPLTCYLLLLRLDHIRPHACLVDCLI